MEDRLIDFLSNWVLWLALIGFMSWRLVEFLEWQFLKLPIRNRENLALFADWHEREQKAQKAGEPFDRQRHRRDFMLGAKPYVGYCDYEEDEDVYGIEKAKADVLNSEKLLRTLIDHSVNGILRLR